jgi:hypothetical protein
MHAVHFVERGALPEGHLWALARCGRNEYYLFVDRSEITEEALEEAWAAYRRVSAGPLPRQRVPA